MRRSTLDSPWFFPVVVVSFALGNAIDLVGTYLYQPHFEHEANPIYLTLQPYGLRLNWPMVILGKVLMCVASGAGLWFFLKNRRRYYPSEPSTFGEMITHWFYGRPLGWIESCFKMPRSFRPGLLGILAIWSFGGAYYAYLGYGNLASKYGWWNLGGFWAGRYWLDWGLIVWTFIATTAFFRLLWDDFQNDGSPAFEPTL